eukprot:symbB.v1.2.024972.t1/scaffold2401.1/size80084/4
MPVCGVPDNLYVGRQYTAVGDLRSMLKEASAAKFDFVVVDLRVTQVSPGKVITHFLWEYAHDSNGVLSDLFLIAASQQQIAPFSHGSHASSIPVQVCPCVALGAHCSVGAASDIRWLTNSPKDAKTNTKQDEAGELHSSEGFDAQREVWLPGFSMRTCRSVAAACIYAEHVYICGGLLYGEIELRSVERLSLERGSWERMPRMLWRRSFFAVCVLDDFLYACGGGNDAYMEDVERLQLKPCGDDYSAETTAASIEAFVPQTGVWKVLTQMPVSRRDMVAAIHLDKLYLCGGSMLSDSSSHLLAGEKSLLMFDLLAQTWSSLAPMNLKRHAACGAFIGGCLYICGGGDGGEFFESTEVFDPADGSWRQLPAKMQSGRRFGACVAARGLCAVDAEVDEQVTQSAVEKTRLGRGNVPNVWAKSCSGLARWDRAVDLMCTKKLANGWGE